MWAQIHTICLNTAIVVWFLSAPPLERSFRGFEIFMPLNKHIIIFSHGFGVQRDSRGLFTELAKMLSAHQIESLLFDYNEVNHDTKEVTVRPFSEQTKLLQTTINETRQRNPDAMIDLLTHSQGLVMAASAKLDGIRRVISLAPFFHTDIHSVLERHKQNPSSEINFTGTSRRVRTDGTTTIIPASYWSERFSTDIYELYNKLALTVPLTIVNAGEDEIMDSVNLSKVFNAYILNIHGNHDFTGESRKKLVEVVEEIVSTFIADAKSLVAACPP